MNRTTEPEAAAIDLDAANARVNAALHPQDRPTPEQAEAALAKIKKTRSDKGTTRPPKVEPVKAGVLTEKQAEVLMDLTMRKIDALLASHAAERVMWDADEKWRVYLDALQRGEA